MLAVHDLYSRYGGAEILRGVSLEVRPGEVAALLGRNGIGKTSLVRSIAGMQPPVPRRGHIRWRGEEITGLPSYEIARRGVAIVPQGRHVFASLTVRENLTVAAREAVEGEGWDLDRVSALFPRLALRMGSPGSTLSGGEQQMLAIARALMINPRLLLMDEPSEGLAPNVVAQVRERIETLRGGNLSILLVEQNLGLAMRVADRVYILGEPGRIVWHGIPGELDDDPRTKRLHLGV